MLSLLNRWLLLPVFEDSETNACTRLLQAVIVTMALFLMVGILCIPLAAFETNIVILEVLVLVTCIVNDRLLQHRRMLLFGTLVIVELFLFVTIVAAAKIAANAIHRAIIHIRRGAILSDIGKLAVLDAILQKPSPLDDQEWVIMRQHPLKACQMLEPIDYLRPALPIPHFRHEHWDENGYPESLKGEDILLPARIFAVVDVRDALRNDQLYRKAWPERTWTRMWWMPFLRFGQTRRKKPSKPCSILDRSHENSNKLPYTQRRSFKMNALGRIDYRGLPL